MKEQVVYWLRKGAAAVLSAGAWLLVKIAALSNGAAPILAGLAARVAPPMRG